MKLLQARKVVGVMYEMDSLMITPTVGSQKEPMAAKRIGLHQADLLSALKGESPGTF